MRSVQFAASLALAVWASFLSAQPKQAVGGSGSTSYVTVKNTKLYFEQYGEGVPLLLLHGGFGSIEDFRKVIPALAQKFHVIAIGSPGHGRSEHADTLTYHVLASYFSGVIDSFQLDSVYLAGWSDGGNVALLLAGLRPEKVKKVLVSGANMKVDEQAADFLNSLTPENALAHHKEWLDAYLNKTPQKDLWRKHVNDVRALWSTKVVLTDTDLKKVGCKTLVMLGDNDSVKLEQGIEMHRKIKDSQFCVVPGTGHGVFSEKPDLVVSIALNFF